MKFLYKDIETHNEFFRRKLANQINYKISNDEVNRIIDLFYEDIDFPAAYEVFKHDEK